jgi:hypothetical protein
MDPAFQSVLTGIANAVGAHHTDIETDHGRWQLYERAMEASSALDLLRQAIALEEDRALAASVVLRMLEQVADVRQADWINQLAPDNRRLSERRAVEIQALRRARDGVLPTIEIAADIGNWSDWLQIRLVDVLVDREGLAILSANGRTKRIRNLAAARLKALPGEPSG